LFVVVFFPIRLACIITTVSSEWYFVQPSVYWRTTKLPTTTNPIYFIEEIFVNSMSMPE
jgi:hypothetical protein